MSFFVFDRIDLVLVLRIHKLRHTAPSLKIKEEKEEDDGEDDHI